MAAYMHRLHRLVRIIALICFMCRLLIRLCVESIWIGFCWWRVSSSPISNSTMYFSQFFCFSYNRLYLLNFFLNFFFYHFPLFDYYIAFYFLYCDCVADVLIAGFTIIYVLIRIYYICTTSKIIVYFFGAKSKEIQSLQRLLKLKQKHVTFFTVNQ